MGVRGWLLIPDVPTSALVLRGSMRQARRWGSWAVLSARLFELTDRRILVPTSPFSHFRLTDPFAYGFHEYSAKSYVPIFVRSLDRATESQLFFYHLTRSGSCVFFRATHTGAC